MQGVFTKILNLWIPNKTDKGTVVTDVFEPNFTKLDQYAETTNQSLEDLKNNKLDKGTYPGNASDLNTEISKIASTTQLGRFKVGTNLRIDENGFLHGNPAVDISGKMDKYKDVTSIISDYDDIIEDGFYIARGSERGTINAPFHGAALVQVWNYGGFVYQNAVSYYNVQSQFTRCFEKGIKNTKWEKIVNTTDIVNNLTTTVPEKVLDARQGPAIVNKINGLAGGYSGTFPLTTAVKEGIYLLPATNKFYVCIKNYSGSSLTAPNANFEELSVYTNRNKLENLFSYEDKEQYATIANFNRLSATIYKISKLCICSINYEYNGVLPKIKIPFPITFVTPPIVTIADNDSEVVAAYNNIGIGWPTTTDVEVKGTITGATLLVIGSI